MSWKRCAQRGWAVAATLSLLPGPAALSQEHDHPTGLRFGAHGVALWTLVDPALTGSNRSEAYLTQPYLTGHMALLGGQVTAMASINLEGLTLRRGELATGNAGEGYVDRRHPHTYVHEAMVVGTLPVGGLDASLSVGRGFAPFGTDDPMVRPFTKYPANHHLAQVLERLVAIAAVRRGPVIVEAGLFNGDEPTGPGDVGRLGRFGDSWAVRATGLPTTWLELQASHARVESPEHVLGGGLDHRKWSTSARVDGLATPTLRVSGLIEWARTDEYSVGQRFFTFESALAEGAARHGPWGAALRVERTTRPEEERLRDPFRSARPHADENILGITRWTTVTGRFDRTFASNSASFQPFVEVARHAVRNTAGILFDPVVFYGDDRLWNLSIGLRLGIGAQHARMGRYGVAVPAVRDQRGSAATGAATPLN